MLGGGFGRLAGTARHAFAAAALIVILPAPVAQADSRLCSQLEAELAATFSGPGGKAEQYDAAISRQHEQGQSLREQSRQAGCASAMVGNAVAFCGGIAAALKRMDTNLAELQRARATVGGGDAGRERSRILAALDANGCMEAEPAPALPDPETFASPWESATTDETGTTVDQNMTSRYRTMCVRMCDGYYFPISYAVPQAAFHRDQNACTAMCPGARVELHYHRVPDEEAEEMVSAATGLPYREMTNAFRHRQTGTQAPRGCGCNAAAVSADRGFVVIGGDHGSGIVIDEPQDRIDIAATHSIPASPVEKPAGLDGSFDPGMLRTLTPATAGKGPESKTRAIRVVGPTFLPDPAEAIDLQVQAPARAQ